MAEDFGLVRDFAIIMAVAGGALVIFRQLGQSTILGYLIAGLIIGPFTLPDPLIREIETIRLLADLGLILLLFALGLEFGWERIRQIGLQVIIIGTLEITFMIALGFEIGLLLGWNGKEAFFLGSALAISSSAILVKMLRDSGRLTDTDGRLIVGILVVEDFAAVVLLSVLSGVATTNTADAGEIGFLIGKLAIFAASALVFGALFVPSLIKFVARFQSQETLLITALALCFGLAVVAHELGISAAAGAFLIGTVMGDSDHSEELLSTMSPVRDMFAALFFVSIGMLVDLSLFTSFIGPALAVSAVFIVGKIIADTTGTFLTGHGGRTALKVGMGMPQIGEFSLAMVKVGSDHGAVGTFMYPVVTVTTAITSLVYPFLFRSANATASFLERKSPALLHQYVDNLSSWLFILRSSFNLKSDAAKQIRRNGLGVLLNLGIMIVFITAGTIILRFTQDLADLTHLPENIVGLIIGVSIVVLCIPPAIFVWNELRSIADQLTTLLFSRSFASRQLWRRENVRAIFRDTILAVVVILVAIWAIPLMTQLLSIGEFSIPVAILLIAGVVFLTGRAAFKVHKVLEATFSRTFLGPDESETQEDD